MSAQIPFLLAYLAIALCWVPRAWWPSWIAFALSLLLALGSTLSLAGLAILVLAGIAARVAAGVAARERGPHPYAARLALFLLTLPLVLFHYHALAGFSPLAIVSGVQVSADAEPYTLKLHFGPVALGFYYVRFFLVPPSVDEVKSILRWVGALTLALVAVLLGTALAMGYVRWDPKWPSFFLIWTLTNLFLVAVSEESLFRGLLQDGLSRLGRPAALLIASLVFGLYHLAWGLENVFLATVAGAFFGYAYLRSARIEAAILLHFVVNAIHFYLFTYPRMA